MNTWKLWAWQPCFCSGTHLAHGLHILEVPSTQHVRQNVRHVSIQYLAYGQWDQRQLHLLQVVCGTCRKEAQAPWEVPPSLSLRHTQHNPVASSLAPALHWPPSLHRDLGLSHWSMNINITWNFLRDRRAKTHLNPFPPHCCSLSASSSISSVPGWRWGLQCVYKKGTSEFYGVSPLCLLYAEGLVVGPRNLELSWPLCEWDPWLHASLELFFQVEDPLTRVQGGLYLGNPFWSWYICTLRVRDRKKNVFSVCGCCWLPWWGSIRRRGTEQLEVHTGVQSASPQTQGAVLEGAAL